MKPTIIKDFPGEAVEKHRIENGGALPCETPFFHATPTPQPCEHDWPDQPSMDSSRCAKCGMSFARHVFTECP